MLDEILARLTDMPEKKRAEIEAEAYAATKDLLFIPSPGPQSAAYFSKADVLLFGGSPGGGKTAVEVGLALNCHKRSLIVRRNFVDLDGVLHTLDNILGKENSAVGGNRPKYRKEGGGVIDFMGLGEDISGKQGNPHDLICVGKATPVLMADGSYRRADEVSKGDRVATLEGPRRVLNAFPTNPKPSVRVTLPSGVEQVQSATHKLLTPQGWRACAASPLSETCAPTESRSTGTLCAQSSGTSPSALRAPAHQQEGLRPADAIDRAWHPIPPAVSSVSCACRGRVSQGSAYAVSGGKRLLRLQRLLLSGYHAVLALPLRLLGAAGRILSRSAPECGARGGPRRLVPPDCQDGCSTCFRPCDGRTPEVAGRRAAQGGAPTNALLLVDVAQHTPTGSPGGGGGIAPTHNPRKWSYAHPYTGGERQSSLVMKVEPCLTSPIGDVELFDLEIEEVNHFITLGGFVNKNCIDEAAQVPENHVRMLLGWLRTDIPGQRCRMVLGSNPPLNSTGDWLIPFFAPWLDPKHPNPAQEGELRYFLPNEDGVGDRECGPDEFVEIHGVKVTPQSRTYISSKFTDNPYYDAEEYAKSLAGLPDEARRILIAGNFLADRSDDIFQTIPTEWVRAAQERWKSNPPVGVPMCAIGVDVAQGGTDNTTLAIRHDGWYAPLIVKPGKETPDGKVVAGLVLSHRRNDAKVIVDIGGGWGGDAYAHLRENQIDAVSYMGVKPTTQRTVDKQLKFFNVRSAAYWRFREALDPSQEGGSTIALPPDSVLLADLCAPTYEIGPNGIKVEPKEKVCDKLSRSPDRGDAVVMAWWSGIKQCNLQGGWKGVRKTVNVVMRKP